MLDRVGSCRIEGEIASGGMAVLYRAVQETLGRPVAVKALKTAVQEDAAFAETTSEITRQQARRLHSAIATCWLHQLGGSRRVTNQNIGRALEAFHHLIASGEADRVQGIAVQLLTGKLEWAQKRIRDLCDYLYESGASIAEQRRALEFAVILIPDDPRIRSFLGGCFRREYGWQHPKALLHFEEACRLRSDFPPNWANLGKALLAKGKEGARDFIQRFEKLENDCPKAIDNHVQAIYSDCLKLVGKTEQAAALRMTKIMAGSVDPAFYNDEAKARLDAGNVAGALEILDLAKQRDSVDNVTEAIRASVLQQSGRTEEASTLRMAKIRSGSHHPAFYNDEAKALLDKGNVQGALEILDLAEQYGSANDITVAIRTNALRKFGKET